MAERIHSQPKPQLHGPSSFNRLILSQVKSLVFVSLMRPSISSCSLHAYFFKVFQASIYVSFLREVFLELLFPNQPECPIILLRNIIYFLYNLYSFISLSLPYWTMNSLKAGIRCVFCFSYLSECLAYGMCAIAEC